MANPKGDMAGAMMGVVLCGVIVAVAATQCEAPEQSPRPESSVTTMRLGDVIRYPDCRDTQPPCLRIEGDTLAVISDYNGQREALPAGASIIRTWVSGNVRWYDVRLP